ncbi:MAG: class I SAM-dependent methyltransferase [Spirochaetes bacterium]|nr:class I SAM-dependent methyltransferase [Spirochaetota bacterium]
MKNFRIIDRSNYPELKDKTASELYGGFIGCGGMFLLSRIAERMNLKKGDIVLDLGCGKGRSSIFLAETYGVTVVALDFWNDINDLFIKAKEKNLADKIIPIRADITENILFAETYFDAVFCMNSLFMFGDNKDFLKKLFSLIKPGGHFYLGSECFNKEPSWNDDVPEEYSFNWSWKVWEECYSKYHSPGWWKSLIESIGMIEVEYCGELDDGRILFEDFVANYETYVDVNLIDHDAVIPCERMASQIISSGETGLIPTLFMLNGKRI